MKKQLLISKIIIVLFFINTYSQCPSGDVLLESQDDINAFATNYPNCTEIAGSLSIGNLNQYSITSLAPLNKLTVIQGQLRIDNNKSLNSLSGLQNITSVGSLWIVNHLSNQLTSLTGLEGLTVVNGNITIGSNSGLTSLNGLSNLETVNGYFWISQNPSLTSFSSMNNLSSIGNHLIITWNEGLTALNAFQNLTSIGGNFQIAKTGLLEISELSNLQSVNGYVKISQNDNLTNISSLQNIAPTSIKELEISSNPALTFCSLTNFCTFLSYNPTTYPRIISGNSGNCIDESSVINSCNSLNTDKLFNNISLSIYKEKDFLHILIDDLKIKKIEIYDTLGKIVYTNQAVDKHIITSNLNINQLLIIKAYSIDGKLTIKKIVN